MDKPIKNDDALLECCAKFGSTLELAGEHKSVAGVAMMWAGAEMAVKGLKPAYAVIVLEQFRHEMSRVIAALRERI